MTAKFKAEAEDNLHLFYRVESVLITNIHNLKQAWNVQVTIYTIVPANKDYDYSIEVYFDDPDHKQPEGYGWPIKGTLKKGEDSVTWEIVSGLSAPAYKMRYEIVK